MGQEAEVTELRVPGETGGSTGLELLQSRGAGRGAERGYEDGKSE